MLVNPLKDLLDAFVIGAVNRIFTVATVENQHFEPWKRRMCVPKGRPKSVVSSLRQHALSILRVLI
jgi:hypothetical protein